MLTCVPSDYDDDYADAGGDFPAAVDQGFEGAFDAFPEQQHNQTSASFQGVEPMGQFMREGTVSPLGVGGQSVLGRGRGSVSFKGVHSIGQSVRGGAVSVYVGTGEEQCPHLGGAPHRTVCEGRGCVTLWGCSRCVRGGAVPVYVGPGEEQCPLLGGAPHRTVCEGRGRVALWGCGWCVRGGAVSVYVGTGEEQCTP